MDSEQVRSSEVAVTPSSKKKHWEHPWTIEEMRKAAQQWNLSSDVGMLLHLQEFSQKLLSQTHEIQEQVDSLNHDAKLTNIRLHNVFNDFVMLANTQFVENRVYDEEVVGQEPTDGNKKLEEKEKTQEQKELELVPKIKLAISLGLNVFDTAYEKLDMNIANSESEDEDTTNRANIYLEAKDPYLHRPLPCLIGSDQFFQTDNLGLGDLLVDEFDDQESDHMSDGEVGGPPPVPQPPHLPERKFEIGSDESDEDLFGESKAKSDTQNYANEEEDDEGEKTFKDDKANAAKNPMTDLQSELTRKLGDSSSTVPPPRRQGSVDKEGVPSTKPRRSKSRPQHMEDNGDLFGSMRDEPTDDIFSRPSRLFTSRPTLFDDDDESGGLFGSQKSQPKEDKPASASTPNKPVPTESESRTSSILQSGRKEVHEEKQSKGKGLFLDEGDDDEDDLFAKKPTPAARQTKETKKPAVSLFEDEEDEDESDIFSSKNKSSLPATSKPAESETKRRIPAGAVSIFGGGDNLFKAAVQKAKDDEDRDDVTGRSSISDKSLSKPSAVAKSLKPTPGSSSPSTMSNSSLFAEDPELFTTMNKSKSSASDLTKESSQPKTKTGFSLFADEDDDDLFSSLSTPSTLKGNKTAGKEPEAKKKAKNFLFEDDKDDGDDGDLFALPKSSTAKDQKKNITVVDEVAPQKTSVEPKPPPAKEPTKEPNKEPTKPNKTKVSLFSGSDDEDDLFSSRKSPAKTKVTADKPATEGGFVKAPGKGRSLFDDDDFLFNTQDDEGPSVDLFKPPVSKVENKLPANAVTSSATPPASPETKSVPVQKPPPSAAPRGTSTRLFGSLDDDEDDLFATLTTKSSEKSKVSPKPAADKTPSVQVTAESSTSGAKGKPKHSLEDIFENKAMKEKPAAEVKETNALAVKSFDDPLGFETAAIKSGPKTPDAARMPASPILQPKGPSDDLFSDSKGLNTGSTKNEQSPPPQSSASPKVLPKAPAKGDRISKLQSAINIDPTSHLPPKIKKSEPEKTESVVVDFSLPAQTPTLHSLAKDRAKIPVKRRPPTRKHAELRDDKSLNGFGIETDEKDFFLGFESTASVVKTEAVKRPTIDDLFSLPKSPAVPDTQRDSTVQPKSNLFEEKEAVDRKSKRDLPGSMAGSGKTTPTASGKEPFLLDHKPPPLADDDSEEDDLFGTSHKSKQTTPRASTAPISATNDFRETGVKNESRQTGTNSELLTGKDIPPNVKSGVKVAERKEIGTSDAPSSNKFNIPDDDGADIFASKSVKTASTNHLTFDTKRVTTAATDSDEDDLFGGKGLLSSARKVKKEDAKAAQSSEKPPALTPSIKDDEDKDLFGTKALIKPSAPAMPVKAAVVATSKEVSSKRPGEILLSSDDDDIFSMPKNVYASSAVNAKTVLAVTPTRDAPPPAAAAAVDDDDDDDIFANSSLAPKGAQKSAANRPKVKEPVFDDDDDDIFASLPSSNVKKPVSHPQPKKEVTADKDDLFAAASSSSRPARKKLVTKDEDLFHDDTDIFADIPSAKVREKKSQGRSIKPAGTPLFTSGPDDIFAEAATTAKSTKVASDAQKPVSATKPKEDYDDIFEDPLNVLRK